MVAERCFFFTLQQQPCSWAEWPKICQKYPPIIPTRYTLCAAINPRHEHQNTSYNINNSNCLYLPPSTKWPIWLSGTPFIQKYDRLSVCLLPPWHYCVCFIFGESEERMRADKRMLHAGNGVIQASQMSSSWWQPKQNNSVIQGTSGRHGEDPQVPNTFAIYEEDNATKRFQVIY